MNSRATSPANTAAKAARGRARLSEVKALRAALRSLEEVQAAIGEISKMIAASGTDAQPVLDSVVEHALRLCDGRFADIFLTDGQTIRLSAHNFIADSSIEAEATAILSAYPRPLDRSSLPGRIILDGEILQFPDVESDPNVTELTRRHARILGYRSGIMVPMILRAGAVTGAIGVARAQPGKFPAPLVQLLQTFANQAAIAVENARLLTETREALEQQTATAEVLQVINSSPGDLAPVFEGILDNAHALCGAERGALFLYDGGKMKAVAAHGYPTDVAEHLRAGIDLAPWHTPLFTGNHVHVPDLTQLDNYETGLIVTGRGVVRTNLLVPLFRNDALLGMITCNRTEVRPFSDREIALIENFAAQAVIAMENARLLTETREALDQQTATAEVLQVINSSPGDLAPVFDVMLEKAMRLCEAAHGVLRIFDGKLFHLAAVSGEGKFVDRVRKLGPVSSDLVWFSDLVRGERLVHIDDIRNNDAYRSDEAARERSDIGRIRTCLFVALRKEDALLGAIIVYRQEVRPFTDKQIALLQNFAAQAVIAMENARLITETRERTRDLQQSLEYQTATSEVLKVISQTTFDLEPMLDFVCRTAARLCNVQTGSIFRLEDGVYRWATGFGLQPAYEALERSAAIAPGMGTLVGRVALTGETVHVLDGLADPDYDAKEELRLSKCHTLLGVPLLREGAVIGVICMARFAIDAFTEQQIALVSTFADQAVIAIENARLFNELRDRTAEVTELNRGLEARVAEQVDELGRVGRLKRFLAPQLAELIVSQGDEKILESHRREIVVVFCDLRGYTAFTETAEPEEVLDFLREYHGALGPLVAEYEGTLDQFSGDGIMVFFNDPVPIPDPADRAVRMAGAMRTAAAALIAAWRRRGRELGFGVGIAQGYATLGQIGFSDRAGYTAIGTVCNVAARLCGEAKDGQILLAQRVAAGLDGSIALEEVGALTLKGLRQPVIAFNVVEQGDPSSRLRLV